MDMSILKIILIGILCLAPEKDGWVRINGDNYISFSFPSRGERFKKEVNHGYSKPKILPACSAPFVPS